MLNGAPYIHVANLVLSNFSRCRSRVRCIIAECSIRLYGVYTEVDASVMRIQAESRAMAGS